MDDQKKRNSACCLLKICKNDKLHHSNNDDVGMKIEDAMKNKGFRLMSLFMRELASVTHILFGNSENITIKPIPPYVEKNGKFVIVYDNVKYVDTYIFDTIIKTVKCIEDNNPDVKNYLYNCYLATKCSYISESKNETPNYFVLEFFSDPRTPNVTFKRDKNTLGVDNINNIVSLRKELIVIDNEVVIKWIEVSAPIFKSCLLSTNTYYLLLIKILSMIYNLVNGLNVNPKFSTPTISKDSIDFFVIIPFIVIIDSLSIFPINDLAEKERFLCDMRIEFQNPDNSNTNINSINNNIKFSNETLLSIKIKKRAEKRTFG